MKKNISCNSNSEANNGEVPKQKERHIVSWSQEEDDILREQIRLHGTENWAIIASKFKDKTTRQCRRRWFTYLNSDFKKGGWSPEEDLLLCEAQKIFGNRWTEIAKVVSGRTDNAVKNRFNTLCKKKAKHEALAKENSSTSYINLNNKRVIFPTGINTEGRSESLAPLKKMRTYVSNTTEVSNPGEKLSGECGVADHLLRPPFSVLAQNVHGCNADFSTQIQIKDINDASSDGSTNKSVQGTFLKKDDPKVLALIQQAELLSSLAVKVNSEKSDQSRESAWMALQEFLKQNKGSDYITFTNLDTDCTLEKIKELVERESDVYDSSPASSEYSTGSTLLSNMAGDKIEGCQTEICGLHQETGNELQSIPLDDHNFLLEENLLCHAASRTEVNSMLTAEDMKAYDGAVGEYSKTEFNSPIHVTPLFRTLAAAIPSPKFSESEKHFLMKTLGIDSTPPSSIANSSQPPHCKRSLLHCL